MVCFKNYENALILRVKERNAEKQKLQLLVGSNVRCKNDRKRWDTRMNVTCPRCSTIYDEEKYSSCPRCQEQQDFDNGPWKKDR